MGLAASCWVEGFFELQYRSWRNTNKVEWLENKVHTVMKAPQKMLTLPDDYMELKIQGLNTIKCHKLFWTQSLGQSLPPKNPVDI